MFVSARKSPVKHGHQRLQLLELLQAVRLSPLAIQLLVNSFFFFFLPVVNMYFSFKFGLFGLNVYMFIMEGQKGRESEQKGLLWGDHC